jgi:hypothetical protein
MISSARFRKSRQTAERFGLDLPERFPEVIHLFDVLPQLDAAAAS